MPLSTLLTAALLGLLSCSTHAFGHGRQHDGFAGAPFGSARKLLQPGCYPQLASNVGPRIGGSTVPQGWVAAPTVSRAAMFLACELFWLPVLLASPGACLSVRLLPSHAIVQSAVVIEVVNSGNYPLRLSSATMDTVGPQPGGPSTCDVYIW